MLDVNDELWEKFKKKITHEQSLNDALNELIEERVKK